MESIPGLTKFLLDNLHSCCEGAERVNKICSERNVVLSTLTNVIQAATAAIPSLQYPYPLISTPSPLILLDNFQEHLPGEAVNRLDIALGLVIRTAPAQHEIRGERPLGTRLVHLRIESF